jgi:hypothetical protein
MLLARVIFFAGIDVGCDIFPGDFHLQHMSGADE